MDDPSWILSLVFGIWFLWLVYYVSDNIASSSYVRPYTENGSLWWTKLITSTLEYCCIEYDIRRGIFSEDDKVNSQLRRRGWNRWNSLVWPIDALVYYHSVFAIFMSIIYVLSFIESYFSIGFSPMAIDDEQGFLLIQWFIFPIIIGWVLCWLYYQLKFGISVSLNNIGIFWIHVILFIQWVVGCFVMVDARYELLVSVGIVTILWLLSVTSIDYIWFVCLSSTPTEVLSLMFVSELLEWWGVEWWVTKRRKILQFFGRIVQFFGRILQFFGLVSRLTSDHIDEDEHYGLGAYVWYQTPNGDCFTARINKFKYDPVNGYQYLIQLDKGGMVWTNERCLSLRTDVDYKKRRARRTTSQQRRRQRQRQAHRYQKSLDRLERMFGIKSTAPPSSTGDVNEQRPRPLRRRQRRRRSDGRITTTQYKASSSLRRAVRKRRKARAKVARDEVKSKENVNTHVCGVRGDQDYRSSSQSLLTLLKIAFCVGIGLFIAFFSKSEVVEKDYAIPTYSSVCEFFSRNVLYFNYLNSQKVFLSGVSNIVASKQQVYLSASAVVLLTGLFGLRSHETTSEESCNEACPSHDRRAGGDKWTCTKCTHENDGGTRCPMCNNPRPESLASKWKKRRQAYNKQFKLCLAAGSIQRVDFDFSQGDSNACAAISLYNAITYAFSNHSSVQDEDFHRSTTSIGLDIAIAARLTKGQRPGSYLYLDQCEPFFGDFLDDSNQYLQDGDNIYSQAFRELIQGHLPDGGSGTRVAIALNCNGHVFTLANRSDGKYDLIDSLPFESSTAFRLTCDSHDDLIKASHCVLSSRSDGTNQSKSFDAKVFFGQPAADIVTLDSCVNTLIALSSHDTERESIPKVSLSPVKGVGSTEDSHQPMAEESPPSKNAKQELDNRLDELVNSSKGQVNASSRQDVETLMNAPSPDQMDKQCPRLRRIYEAVKAHHERVKHCRYKDGSLIYWTYPDLPWDKRSLATTNDPLCADVLHYNTIEAARSLKGQDHCAKQMRSDKTTLCSDTWDLKKEMIDLENYMKCIHVDTECVSYFAYKELSDVLSDEYIELIRNSYKNVLEVIEEECVVCFSSKAAMKMYADWVHGSEKKLQKVYNDNRDKFITADVDNTKLVAGYHPCSLYKKKFRSNMRQKIDANNALGTAQKRYVSGDAKAESNYCSSIVDVNSDAYKAFEERYRAGCRLGGITTGRIRSDAMRFVNWLLESDLCENKEQAMEMLKQESKKHYNVYQGCFDGYDAAVESVCAEREEEFSRYCTETFPDVNITAENVDPKVLYECQKSFFGHEGHEAAVESNYQKHKTACLKWCKTTEDKITDEQKESYMGHCGKVAGAESHYKKNKTACLKWCKTTEDKITDEQKESYMGHCGGTEGFKASVESTYQKNKDACLKHLNTTEEEITDKQKKTYFGHCTAKKRAARYGGKKRDGSEIDRTATTARMNSDDNPVNDPDSLARRSETKRMNIIKEYADDPKKANFIMTRNRCLGCDQTNPPAIVGLKSHCVTEDCEHCTIPKNKNDLSKGYHGVKIPKPGKISNSGGEPRWEHVYTLSNDEKNKEIEKANNHEDVLRDRNRQGSAEYRKREKKAKISSAPKNDAPKKSTKASKRKALEDKTNIKKSTGKKKKKTTDKKKKDD